MNQQRHAAIKDNDDVSIKMREGRKRGWGRGLLCMTSASMQNREGRGSKDPKIAVKQCIHFADREEGGVKNKVIFRMPYMEDPL